MNKYDLSVIIPARNEMWLNNTIEDILLHKKGKTQIIVGLDGQWPTEPIKQHPDVVVLFYPESIGQRAISNQCVKLSRARWIMKLDGHCSFDEGFDVKLMADMQDDWTVVPVMRNLHVFDWKCRKCGKKWYQGPTPTSCPNCDNTTDFKRKVVWRAKESPQSTSYCFDSTPHFQYNKEWTKREEYKNGIVVGYKLSFDKPSLSLSVISLLADFADSHHLTSGIYSFWGGENVTVNTVGFSAVDSSRCARTSEVGVIGDQLKVGGVTTLPISTDMVNNGDVLASTTRNGANEPSVSNTMCECFLSEMGAPSITTFVDSSLPIPATSKRINSNIVDELNRILGGEFVYNEKTNSFHNVSVALNPIYDNSLVETMSLQGSCFMLTRDKYWELNICDEAFGSWGSQGIEVAVKTWLSGGKCIVNKKTWYAHLFRTQGGDFGFPYENPGTKVEAAKKYAKEKFFNKDLVPLLEKFWPVPGWSEEALNELRTK